MTRNPTSEELSHERLGPRFAAALSGYDTARRVSVLVDEFLSGDLLRGRQVLDVGCGLGFFSERLVQLGAFVTSCDIGPTLLTETRARAKSETVIADAMELEATFGPDRFDVVVSSECIEHTPSPATAVTQMLAVTKPGGVLSLSTPNRLWQPVVRGASLLNLRPFDGHENFSGWTELRKTIHEHGADVVRERGLHLFPFQIPLHGLSTWCDTHLQVARGLMINICLLARKRTTAAMG